MLYIVGDFRSKGGCQQQELGFKSENWLRFRGEPPLPSTSHSHVGDMNKAEMINQRAVRKNQQKGGCNRPRWRQNDPLTKNGGDITS